MSTKLQNIKHPVLLAVVLCIIGIIFLPLPQAQISYSENRSSDGFSGAFIKAQQSIPKSLDKSDFRIIKKYAKEYGIDYRLIIAIIRQESRFDKEAVSHRGAQGIMQIMPVTNAEISEEIEILDPTHPHENIRAGVYYIAKLLSLFKKGTPEDRMSLALAAYNAGPSRIYDAQQIAAYMGESPAAWSSVEKALPLLSKRYYTLHSHIWKTAKPRNGYYGSWRQTVTYVNNVMEFYKEYRDTI
jgi:membrane-bound lytic murein transglycosylase F